MHGLDIPDEVPRVRVGSAEAVSVSCLEAGTMREIRTYVYVKMPYWRFNKPLLWYFALATMDEEETTALARRVFAE